MDMTNTFLGIEFQTWVEMFVGLFFEGLLLGLIFQYFSNKSQKKTKRHIQDHTDQIDTQLTEIKNELNTLEVITSTNRKE